MLSIRINDAQLKTTMHGLALECANGKRRLRVRWDRPMADEQKLLCRLRRKLTELHVLRAWARGKVHVTVAPRGLRDATPAWEARLYAKRIAERLAPDYALGVQAAAEGEVRA